MPELPEVETIVQRLRRGEPVERGLPEFPPPAGHAITGVWLDWPGAAYPCGEFIARCLPGCRIQSISRRGKYIVFELKRSGRRRYLLIHLKMSGRLDVLPEGTPRARHVHFVFTLDNGYELRFSDARKFGRVCLVDRAEEITGRLGMEPLDGTSTLRSFRRMMEQRSGALKPLLLDQTFIAGIGNIYADEALWRARLHPLRRADSLKREEAAALWRGLRAALKDGIRHEGAAIDWVYPNGGYQDHFRVYGRKGEPCRRCGAAIQRIVVRQRGTHFCPICQRPPRPG